MRICEGGRVQRYKCKGCGCQYTRSPRRGRPLQEKLLAVTLYLNGRSRNAIAQWMGVSTPGILDWARRFAKEHYVKPHAESNDVVLAQDERWHYLQKNQKLWIWKVLDSVTGQLLEWECSDQNASTLKRIYERIKH